LKLFVLVLLLVVHKGEFLLGGTSSDTILLGTSLKCYDCDGYKGQQNPCEDLKEKDAVSTEHCDGDEVCVVYTFKNPLTGTEKISRSCGSKGICDTLKGKDTESNKLLDCDTCHSDLCGSGEFVSASVVTLVLSLILGSYIN
jgi:hypothetical protein